MTGSDDELKKACGPTTHCWVGLNNLYNKTAAGFTWQSNGKPYSASVSLGFNNDKNCVRMNTS